MSALPDFSGAEMVWMARSELDGALRQAMTRALPPGTTFAFEFEGDRAWIMASPPADTRQILRQALAELGRP